MTDETKKDDRIAVPDERAKPSGGPEIEDKSTANEPTKSAKPKENKLKLFLEALSPREKTAVKIAGGIIGFLFLDLILVAPITRYITQLDEEIHIEEKIIPKRLMILKHRDTIVGEYKKGKPRLTDPKLTQEEEIAKLLREIERVSKESNLFIFNINPVKTSKKSETVSELTVDIEGKGTMDQLRHFMMMIENANPSVCVSGFNIRPQSKESDDLKFMLSIAKFGLRETEISF
ncbi:MAG: type 4a pilus biogenesis protein PilO [Candidatus Omnitrophota bacterium]